jgi:hypothetical protein
MKEDLCTKELQQTPKHKKKGGTANKGIVLATEEMCSERRTATVTPRATRAAKATRATKRKKNRE